MDADYVGYMDKRRSTSSYVLMFIGGAMSWRSCLQNCTSLYTTEAEYTAATEACKEAKGACVEGYTDADYVGDMDKRRSTLG